MKFHTVLLRTTLQSLPVGQEPSKGFDDVTAKKVGGNGNWRFTRLIQKNGGIMAQIVKPGVYAAVILLMSMLSTQASATGTVTYVGCADYDNPPSPDVSRPKDVPADVSPLFGKKISFYGDTNRAAGTFAPSGWACQVNSLPNSYAIEVVPDANDFSSKRVPFWKQPLIDEQLFSPDGGIPDAVNFYALGVSVFPKFFPGGLNKWIGDPLRSNGELVTDSELKAMVRTGPHDTILYINDHVAEFTTPANTTGLGTMGAGGRLGKQIFPTFGVVGIGPMGSGAPMRAELFAFRLSPDLSYLKRPLLKLATQELARDLKN
jgi:hypothetical protein